MRDGYSLDFWAFSSSDTSLMRKLGLSSFFSNCYEAIEFSLSEVKNALARYEIALGSAYHFCVINASVGTPVVCITDRGYYKQKIEGVLAGKFEWVRFCEFDDQEQFSILANHLLNKSFIDENKNFAIDLPSRYEELIGI